MNKKNEQWIGWLFVATDGRIRSDRDWKAAVGATIRCDERLGFEGRGLHAFINMIDALHEPNGPVVCRVELLSPRVENGEKTTSQGMIVHSMAVASGLLQEFALHLNLHAFAKAQGKSVRELDALSRREAIRGAARLDPNDAAFGASMSDIMAAGGKSGAAKTEQDRQNKMLEPVLLELLDGVAHNAKRGRFDNMQEEKFWANTPTTSPPDKPPQRPEP